MIIKISNTDINKRLDAFLADYLKLPRQKIIKILENKIVSVNNNFPKNSYKTKSDDIITIDDKQLEDILNPDLTIEPYDYNLDIIYEDEDLAVVNKPKNMLTHPTKFDNKKTLVNALVYRYKNNLSSIDKSRPGIVHRLDKNTSGLIIIAKNNTSYEILSNQIRLKTLKRKYLAIALGKPFTEKIGTINKPVVHYLKNDVKMMIAPDNEGLEAITNYSVIEEFKGATLVELELKTGRTHQIRVHLASIEHPVFGDSLYGAKSYMINEFYNLKTTQQLLQSYYMSFIHPTTNKKMEFSLQEKQFSEDFIKVLNFLRRKNEHRNN